jgi:AraC-like DNA-binding protein
MYAYESRRVVALVRDVEWQRHMRNALGRSSIVRWVRDIPELDEAVGLAPTNVVLWHLEPGMRVAANMPANYRHIRISTPAATIVVYCSLASQMARLLLEAGRLGVDRVALRGYDDLTRVVTDCLQEQRYARATDSILTRLELKNSGLAPVLARIIRHAFEAPFGVEELAHDLGIDRKTLRNRLCAASLPSPAVLISWSRLFAAGWLLDESTQTVAVIGRALGFASTSALRGMLARYVHARPTELRQRGALDTIVAAFRAGTVLERPIRSVALE